ncbi:cytochrome c, partial [uncultured Limnohabitans sp.]|uniref:c-type cytochrome n=1 Tax=uncultured Limnohabitans sp. TaxID=768543 RepID=UPI0026331A44
QNSDSPKAVATIQQKNGVAGTTIKPPTNTAGRLLASNCFQCHGTGGVGGFEKIRGGEAAEVREYLTRSASSSIMAAHAQGYTSAQLQAIISYLQQ